MQCNADFMLTSRANATMATLPLSTSACCKNYTGMSADNKKSWSTRASKHQKGTLQISQRPLIEQGQLHAVLHCYILELTQGLACSDQTQACILRTQVLTFVKGPAPLCSMSAPRRAGMMDATMIVTKAPRIAKGAVLSCRLQQDIRQYVGNCIYHALPHSFPQTPLTRTGAGSQTDT